MSAQCSAVPISFLRLERYALGELNAPEREQIAAHLGTCTLCRSCFDELQASELPLPSLPALSAPRKPARPRMLFWGITGGMLAAAAALLLITRPALDRSKPPAAADSHTKGGELTLSLVRQQAGSSALDPSVFAPGDRFSAQVTCPPQPDKAWDLVVFQAGQAFFPLQPTAALHCANHAALPGAFTLTGTTPASVCVVLTQRVGVDRTELRRLGPVGLPATSACTIVAPVQ
jgi:hypothetical protein